MMGMLCQFLLVLFQIATGLISCATWNLIETRVYAASSFVLFALNLIKYGMPFMDPVIFSLDCLLLILAFISLRISVGRHKLKLGQQLKWQPLQQQQQAGKRTAANSMACSTVEQECRLPDLLC